MLLTAVIVALLTAGAYVIVMKRRGRYFKRAGAPWIPTAAEEDDFRNLQGRWVHESTGTIYAFDGDLMLVTPPGKPESLYSFRLDATREPRQLDIVASWASGRIATTEAVYELSSDTMRWAHVAGRRPPRFPEPGSAGTIVTLRRMDGQRIQMRRAVKIRTLTMPHGNLENFDPGEYLATLEFYDTAKPVSEEERDGLAQLTHYLAYLALRAKSTRWETSVISRGTLAYRAFQSYFGHLDGWEEVANGHGIRYRDLVNFLMRDYPPRRKP